jgi:hypothetical protein
MSGDLFFAGLTPLTLHPSRRRWKPDLSVVGDKRTPWSGRGRPTRFVVDGVAIRLPTSFLTHGAPVGRIANAKGSGSPADRAGHLRHSARAPSSVVPTRPSRVFLPLAVIPTLSTVRSRHRPVSSRRRTRLIVLMPEDRPPWAPWIRPRRRQPAGGQRAVDQVGALRAIGGSRPSSRKRSSAWRWLRA